MQEPTEMGEFLRNRRGQLTPQDVGLVSYGARRVPGLRREELAQIAGVSATYYMRLEQGRGLNVSDEILSALARALRLNPDESAHLRDLARSTSRAQRPAALAEQAGRGVRQMIGAMDMVAAVVMNRRSDVLAWNPLAHALLAGHLAADAPDTPATRPNLTRMLFIDPQVRRFYSQWDAEAERAVSSLRLLSGRHSDDGRLADLIDELTVKSPEFSRLWLSHSVVNCTSGMKYARHPHVGAIELAYEVMNFPDGSAQRLLLYSAEPGSSSEAALRLLRQEVAAS